MPPDPPDPPEMNMGPAPSEGAARIRTALEEHGEELRRAIALKLGWARKPLHRARILEQATEVMHEVASRALARPERLDLSRSVYGWLMGIATHVLLETYRDERRERRQVNGTDLGEEIWAQRLQTLCLGSSDRAVGERLDLNEALAQLEPQARHALMSQYQDGLSGMELASTIGVSTRASARTRVSRALQQLRVLMRPQVQEDSR